MDITKTTEEHFRYFEQKLKIATNKKSLKIIDKNAKRVLKDIYSNQFISSTSKKDAKQRYLIFKKKLNSRIKEVKK